MNKKIKNFIFGIILIVVAALYWFVFYNPSPPYQEAIITKVNPKGDENYLHKTSDYLFNDDTLHTFEINISLEDLDKIDSDPSAEEYVEGNLKFNGEVISPVGVRYKGSIGSFVGALSGWDWANPSGHKTATKISMKVKIDWKEREQTFYGVKKLQFHSQNLDPSRMHERLGYWLFREMRVPAPRSVHARLILNGVYQGVYALTEQIDEQFVKEKFADTTGNLYKEVWPLNYLGEVEEESTFQEHLKTNKEQKANVEFMKNFADEIVAADSVALRDLIKSRMDLNQIISYAMIDRMIRHDDGPFHWYCDENGCSNHNYYWYVEPATQKIHLIPWDLDDAFTNIGYGKSSVTTIYNKWGETSNDCVPFAYGALGIYQKSAACDKLTGGWTSFHQEYDSLKVAFKAGPFSPEKVLSKIDKWSNQIREANKEARMTHHDALDEEEWDEALENLKGEVKHSWKTY